MIRIINSDLGEIRIQPMSCILSLAINGVWVLKMEHPYDKEGRWQYITEDSVLYVDVDCLDGVSSEQQYRITLCQRSLTSVYVEAYPIALDAFNDRVFTSVVRNGATPSKLAQDITSTDYPVTTNLPNTLLADYKYENTNLIAIINGGEDCFIEKYGGEIKYNNNAISINNRLDSGSTSYVYAGRDVTSLMHSVNTSDVITRIYPLSANGMRLNARGDATVSPGTPYVDSQYKEDYGVVHSEFIKTHFMLCTEDAKNADVSAFDRTMQFRNEIFEEVQNWMQDLAYNYEYIDDTKRNIEYLQSILKLTKEKNKNSGIIEGLQKAITAELTNVAFKQMVNNWIKDACEEFDNIDAPEYKLVKVGTDQYIYADVETNDRAIGEWHRLDSKWRWFAPPNGYLDDNYDNNKNWSWYADTGAVVTEGQPFPKLYGSKSDNIFLRDQWEKINGTWYWFDQQGHHLKPSTQIKNMVRWIVTNYGASSFASEVANMEKQLYEEMYQRMVEHSEWLFSEGVDRPKMEINLEAMDISQIEGYQQLQTLSLGNNVVFRNNGTTINERVVELEYDCIRKVNTRIVLGMPTETISAIISRNIEINPSLIAGYGVDIDGNVIMAYITGLVPTMTKMLTIVLQS
jgi:phage minor structural protein